MLFTRYPVPGQTKTRMILALGPEGAADLQREMTEHVMRAAGGLRVGFEVRFEGGSDEQMRDWLGADVTVTPQGEGDLGERMARAFADRFSAGAESVSIIGADCPSVTGDLLDETFAALRRRDLVLGPAADGGYYLIGLRRPEPLLFADMPWGSDQVLAVTLRRAEHRRLTMHLLPELPDVDRPEDLPVWEAARARVGPPISVIVPTLNEAGHVRAAVAGAMRGAGVEVIVADGGSTDGTVDLASAAGATVVQAEGGRAWQLNAGAGAAGGEMLLFLHADTVLPWGWDDQVRDALGRPGIVAGAFRLRISGHGVALRCLEALTHFRARRMQMPYGDQAVFVTRERFRQVGGFPDIPLMEDFEFARRVRRLGRIEVLPAAVLSSGRRWHRMGTVRASALNQLIIVAHLLGVSPERLARWYRGSRRGP